MVSGRPTWLICKISKCKTIQYNICLPAFYVGFNIAWTILMYTKNNKTITSALEQNFTIANSRHARCLPLDKGKKYFNSNFKVLIKRNVIHNLLLKTSKKWPWLSDLIEQSKLDNGHIWKTAAPCAGKM